MDDRAVINALLRLGGRASVVESCPVCGRPITAGQDRIKAWPGKYAHARCASYGRRGNRRHRGESADTRRRAV